MSPIPGWQAIPPNWTEAIRPVAEDSMDAVAQLLRPSGPPPYPKPPYPKPPEWSPWTTLAADVPCRLQELKREGAPVPGDQPTQIRSYLVTMPLARVPDTLRVGEGGDTVEVLGHRYQILQRMRGSYLAEVDLICQHNQTQEA